MSEENSEISVEQIVCDAMNAETPEDRQVIVTSAQSQIADMKMREIIREASGTQGILSAAADVCIADAKFWSAEVERTPSDIQKIRAGAKAMACRAMAEKVLSQSVGQEPNSELDFKASFRETLKRFDALPEGKKADFYQLAGED